MSEEKNVEATEVSSEPAPHAEPQSIEIDARAVRTHQLFKDVTGKQKEEISTLKSRLAELEKNEAEKEQAIAQAKASEEGRLKEFYEAKLAEQQALVEQTSAAKASEIAEMKLQIAAANVGVTNPIVQRGLYAEYQGLQVEEGKEKPTPDEWLAGLANSEMYAGLFGGPKPIGSGPAGKPSGRGNNTASLKERLANFEPEAMAEAREILARGGSIN